MQEILLLMAKALSKKQLAQQLKAAAEEYLKNPTEKNEDLLDCTCFIFSAKKVMGDRTVEACAKEIGAINQYMEIIHSDKIKQQ